MLFRKNIEPHCAYCTRSEELDEDHVACLKKGVVSAGYHCRSFEYDPLKRTPPEQAVPDFSHFSDEDFSL